MAEIKIESDHINELIRNAILESSIGDSLRAAIDTKIKELGYSYNNPVKAAVDSVVNNIVRDIVEKDSRPAIEAKVKECLTQELMDKIVNAAWSNLMDSISRR